VENIEFYIRGQRRLDFGQPLLNALNDRSAVLAEEHHGHADDDFATAVAGGGALAGERGDDDLGHVANENRQIAWVGANDNTLDIADVAEHGFAANEALLPFMDDVAAARVGVVMLQGLDDLFEADAEGRHA